MANSPFRSPEAIPAEIQALPKTNLHTHMEGCVRVETVIELAKEQGIRLGVPDDQVADSMQVTGQETSLGDYLAKVTFTQPVMKNAAALRRICFEAAEDAARCNVRYYELRAGPTIHVTPTLSLHQVIEAMLAGLADAENKYDMKCRLIVASLRHDPAEKSIALARAALDFRGKGVVGFDLAGDEALYPAVLHREAFEIARGGGLGITVHAGEASDSREVVYAVETLGATRIGHGAHSIEDPRVVEMLRERGITLEICPTSNVHTCAVPSIEQHPLPEFLAQGIRITIGDDDPITSRTDMSRELALLHQQFGMSLATLRSFQVNGMECSFLEDAAQRAQLLSQMRGNQTF
jgi:adenosine deaminase